MLTADSPTLSFTITNIGFESTDQLNITISLPSGSQVSGSVGQQVSAGGGWTCVITATGATCQHSAISAFGGASGNLDFTVSNSADCGATAHMTVTSAGDSASTPAIIIC